MTSNLRPLTKKANLFIIDCCLQIIPYKMLSHLSIHLTSIRISYVNSHQSLFYFKLLLHTRLSLDKTVKKSRG